MAHEHQLCFISTLTSHLARDYTGANILEVGSYNVIGSIRDYFKGSTYVGVDLYEGPGVDLISDGKSINLPDSSQDITVSCESFEHNPFWLETFENMYRIIKSGGFVIFTCATRGRAEHGTSRTSPGASPVTTE